MDYGSLANIGGILLSVILYVLADRKTLGAKREKANAAYEDLLKTIFRSIVREDYIPSADEIQRMISTKCLENKLKVSQFPMPLEFVNAIYTRVMQDEVLEGKSKKKLVEKINKYIESNSKIQVDDSKGGMEVPRDNKFRILLMVMSSAMAVLFTFITTITPGNIFSFYQLVLLLATFISAITFMMILNIVKIFKEGNSISPRSNEQYDNYKRIEKSVSKIIKGLDCSIEPNIFIGNHIMQPDFAFKKDKNTYFIEIRSFNKIAQRSAILNLVNFGTLIKKQSHINVTILVTDNKQALSPYLNEIGPVFDHVFDELEFKMFINQISDK